MFQATLEAAEGPQRVSKSQTNVDSLLEVLTRLGMMTERRQRLLEVRRRLLVGRARECFGPGLPEIGQRLVPDFAANGVMGQPLYMLREAVTVKRLDRVDDPGVKIAPTVLQEAAVGDIVREGMLEGVLEVGKEARLVQELGGLEVREPLTNGILGHVRDGLQECQGYVFSDNG